MRASIKGPVEGINAGAREIEYDRAKGNGSVVEMKSFGDNLVLHQSVNSSCVRLA